MYNCLSCKMLHKLVYCVLFWWSDNLKCAQLCVIDLFHIWSSSSQLPSYGKLKNNSPLFTTFSCLPHFCFRGLIYYQILIWKNLNPMERYHKWNKIVTKQFKSIKNLDETELFSLPPSLPLLLPFFGGRYKRAEN